MSKAASYLDRRSERADLGAGLERPPDLPPSEIRTEAIRRLANAKTAGPALLVAWSALRDARPLEVEETLRSMAGDPDLPRVVRARFAKTLFEADRDRWSDFAAELPEGDDLLPAEGYMEVELTLLSCGARTAEDFAVLCAVVPEEERADLAPAIERIRASTGPAPLEAYGPALEQATLSAFWPAFAEAIAATPSPEALAALDLALLVSPPPPEAAEVRRIRERVLAARPSARRAPSRGQAFLSAESPYRGMNGTLAIARGRAHLHFWWRLPKDGPLDVRSLGAAPPGAHEAVRNIVSGEDGLEVPFDEACAFLAEAGTQLTGGTARELAPFRDALRNAPPLPEVEPGAPLSDEELRAAFDLPAFRDWLPSTPPRDLGMSPRQFAPHLAKAHEGELQTALARQLHWLRWHGEHDLARRLAAHLPGAPGGKAHFRRFARMWALRFGGG